MITRRWIIGLSLLAMTAAGAVWWQAGTIGNAPASLSDDGIGPLRLQQDFGRAEQRVFRLAPDSAFSGPGCSGLDELRYETRMGGHPVSIMAMAEDGRIEDVEVALMAPRQAHGIEACRELRDQFAEMFIRRFGDYTSSWQVSKPVSQELWAQAGPVLLKARWFRAGGDCHVSAHFGAPRGSSLSPETTLARSAY